MTRLQLKDLTPGQAYRIQLRSVGDGTVSEWSRRFTITTSSDTTPPDVPTWVASPNEVVVNGDAFIITWNPIDTALDNNRDFSHYEVTISDGTTSRTIRSNNTSYTLTFEMNAFFFGSAKDQIFAKVRSVDQVGNASAYTTEKTATNPAPAAPASIAVVGLYDSIKVDWASVVADDLVGYRLFVSTTSASTGFTQVYEGPDTSYVYNTLSYATSHWFRVVAYDKFNSTSSPTTSSSVSPKSAISVDTTPPNGPTGVTLSTGFDSAKQDSYITLSWTASTSTDIANYEIRYTTTSGSNYQYVVAGKDVTSIRIEGLVPGTIYYADVRAVDYTANVSSWVAPTPASITTTADTTAPSQPAAPTAATGSQKIQVTISGNKAAGGAMENDVAFYEVYADTSSGFTPSTANMIGTVQRGPVMIETFQIPAASAVTNATSQDWYVKIRAVDRSNNPSPYSPASSAAAVGLILTANIADANITSAKIQSLTASKITTGTIDANTITVGSTGFIQSSDYAAGSLGYRLTNNSLEINNGSISASSLRLQIGQNIAPIKYADFEGQPSSYTPLTNPGTGISTIILQPGEGGYSPAKFNNQHLRIQWASTLVSGSQVFLTDSVGDYNINVEANVTYILSAYVWNTGTVSTNVQLRAWFIDSSNNLLLDGEAAATTVASGTAVNGAVRLSGPLTAPSGAVRAVILLQSNTTSANGGFNIDGIQFERKTGLQNVPSEWRPPSSTTIDGGLIRTGEIRSNNNLVINSVSYPYWSINSAGNAQFGNLVIRGNTVVGGGYDEDSSSDESGAGSVIRSQNYGATDGWAIYSNGLAVFRNVMVGSFPGEAIADGTLKAEAIESGSVLAAKITASPDGGIFATGEMGEEISLTGSGFNVLSPYQVPMESISISSNIATVTTRVPHGFVEGNKVVIIGTNQQGVDITSTIKTGSITANTFQYDVPDFAGGTYTANTPSGIAKSWSSSTSAEVQRLPLVSFPTDGSNPNIISGKLTTDDFTLQTRGTLAGPVSLDNATFTISAGVTAPTSEPVTSITYDILPLSKSVSGTISGTVGPGGNYFVLIYNPIGSNSAISIEEYSKTTGSLINRTDIGYAYNPSLGSTSYTISPRGLIYVASRNKFYYSYSKVTSGGAPGRPVAGQTYPPYRYEVLETLDPTTFATEYTNTLLTDEGNDALWRGSTIGLDIVNSPNRLIHFLSNNGTMQARYVSINGTTNYADGAVSAGTADRTFSSIAGMQDPRFIVRLNNNADFGNGERFVIKGAASSGITGTNATNIMYYTSHNSAGTIIANESWAPAEGSASPFSIYDSTTKTFYSRVNSGIAKYESGTEAYWSDTSSQYKTRYIAYSYYDSVPVSTLTVTNKSLTSNVATLTTTGMTWAADDVGRWVEVEGVDNTFNGWAQITAFTANSISYSRTAANVTSVSSSGSVKYKVHETNISPIKRHSFLKRSKIAVSINKIPYYSPGEFPDKARVYLSLNGAASTFYRRDTISQPNTSIVITTGPPTGLPGSQMPGTNNGFTIVNSPSRVQTTDGTYYLDGLGTLVVNKFSSKTQPYALGYRFSSAGSFPNNTWSNFGTADSQTLQGGITYDTPTGRYIVPEEGVYQIEGQVQFAANATGFRGIGLSFFNSAGSGINNILYSYSVPGSATPNTTRISASLKLPAGTQIQPIINQNSGGSLALNVSSNGFNYVSVTKLS